MRIAGRMSSTHWCPTQYHPTSVPSQYPLPFLLFLPFILLFFPLSGLSTLLSLSFEWHDDAHCPSCGVQILMSFPPLRYCFISFYSSFFYITSELTQLLHTVYNWCSTRTHSRVFTLVDNHYNMDYTVLMLMDTVYTMYDVLFSGSKYYLYYALRRVFSGVDTIYTIYALRSKQWIFEIEDGAFFEDRLPHEVVARKCPNVSSLEFFGCSGKHHFNICRMHVCVCIRMKTSRSKSVAPWSLST